MKQIGQDPLQRFLIPVRHEAVRVDWLRILTTAVLQLRTLECRVIKHGRYWGHTLLTWCSDVLCDCVQVKDAAVQTAEDCMRSARVPLRCCVDAVHVAGRNTETKQCRNYIITIYISDINNMYSSV